MKRVVFVAVLLLLVSVTSRADSFVDVTISPTTWVGLSDLPNGLPNLKSTETIRLSFEWDTTTDTLFDVKLKATGPFGKGLSGLQPSRIAWTSYGLDFLEFAVPNAFVEISNEGLGSGTVIPTTPGTYGRPIWFECSTCDEHQDGEMETFITVTPEHRTHSKSGAVGDDPTPTPEPSTLMLLGLGLTGLLLRKL
jgi:PEP-CTERM motif-containing protein